METPILLLDEKDGGSHGQFRWSYVLALKDFHPETCPVVSVDQTKGVDLGAEV